MTSTSLLVFSVFLILVFSNSYSQVLSVPLCSCTAEFVPPSCCLTPDNEQISISACQCKCSYNGIVISAGECSSLESSECICSAEFAPVCCKNKISGELFTASNDGCCMCEGEVVSNGECSTGGIESDVLPTPEVQDELETPEA